MFSRRLNTKALAQIYSKADKPLAFIVSNNGEN